MGAPRVRSVTGRSRSLGGERAAGMAIRHPRAVVVTPAVRDADVSLKRVAAIQRSRLVAAALREIDERSYAGTTVAHIASRSPVSRRTFYELFSNREECLGAVLEQAV